jgi:hypothetical protein
MNETPPFRVGRPRWFQIATAVLVVWLVAGFWYVEAGNFSYSNVPGTYLAKTGEITIILHLGKDRTYEEDVSSDGRTKNSSGTWDLFPSDSQGHIHFSGPFIDNASNKPGLNKYANLENRFGMLSFTLDAPRPITFHKKFSDGRQTQ